MDVDRQWIKSSSGLGPFQTHRNDSFCAYTVLSESCDVFVVSDALKDCRFQNNKFVLGYPHIRFYAGASLIVAGVKIGSLCILDTKPRYDFNIEQRMNLLDLGDAVANIIKERRESNLRAKKDRSDLMIDLMHNIRTPLMSLNIASSILDRNNNIRSSSTNKNDSETYELCIQDVVAAAKEIQVQVENTINMSGTFVNRDSIDSFDAVPFPLSNDEITSPVEIIDVTVRSSHITSQNLFELDGTLNLQVIAVKNEL